MVLGAEILAKTEGCSEFESIHGIHLIASTKHLECLAKAGHSRNLGRSLKSMDDEQ